MTDVRDDAPERIARLIADLDAGEYEVREKASSQLLLLGGKAHSALREAISGSASAELKVRANRLLKNDSTPEPSPERRQAERTAEALERSGTAEARHVLRELSQYKQNTWLQGAVTEALQRLERVAP